MTDTHRPSKLHTCSDACGYCRATSRLAAIAEAVDAASPYCPRPWCDAHRSGGDHSTNCPDFDAPVTSVHLTRAERAGSIGDGPAWQATCAVCGQVSPRYAAHHSAQDMADWHAGQSPEAVAYMARMADAPASGVTVREYTPHTGRVGYSVASADGARVWLVTPDTGPGKMSPVRGWRVWKSDSLGTIARFAGTDAGRYLAVRQAVALAGRD